MKKCELKKNIFKGAFGNIVDAIFIAIVFIISVFHFGQTNIFNGTSKGKNKHWVKVLWNIEDIFKLFLLE